MEYDEARALLRYLVKLGEKDRSLFRTSITSLLDPYDLSRLSVGPKWVYIGSDSNGFEAGGGGGVMSGIEFDQGEWTFGLAEDYGAALRAHCGDADDDLIIAVTELLIVIVMAAQYGHRWTGCVVCALIDNDNAKCWLRTRVADNRYVRYLLQILAVLEFKFKFRVISYYVNTKMNFLTDYIGRDVEMDRSDRIELLQTSLIDVFVPGMVYREMDSLLLYFTSGHTVLST